MTGSSNLFLFGTWFSYKNKQAFPNFFLDLSFYFLYHQRYKQQNMCNLKLKKYLFWFAQDQFATEIKQFRKSEILSITKLLNISIEVLSDQKSSKPFWIVRVADTIWFFWNL